MASSAPRVQVPEVLKRRKCFIHIDLGNHELLIAKVMRSISMLLWFATKRITTKPRLRPCYCLLPTEQIRLGLTADVPLVSQQWNAIIAVNYTARKYGITRLHHNIFDAKQLCPELVCAHVATLGPGDSQPDYYPSPSRYTHKVSLDPYRKASAKIFTVFRRFSTKYQKGGLDEVFMDVTDIANQRIMDRYGDDLSKWERYSAEMINWKRDHPDVGVVFGMPLDDDTHGTSSGTEFPDEDEDEGGGIIDWIKTEDDVESEDEGNEVEPQSGNEQVTENEQASADDFDLHLERYLDVDFDDSFAISQANEGLGNDGKPYEIQAQSTTNSEGSDSTSATEKRSEEERLRLEKEQLLPYYGIPEGTFEEEFWAEMQLLMATEYCKEIRFAVKAELGYTCSAGIANNRLLAKVGSGMNKPFQQTIVLPRYTPDLLHGLKISKIRNLGGKFGKQVKEDFSAERASQLWTVPLRQLQQRYGEQAGLELWQWCRGIDHEGVRKIKSKSMCSHKSFIPPLNDLEEIQFWISSMSLELESRMQAEFDETERWPRTISLGFFGGRRAWQDQQEQQGQQEYRASFRAPHKGSRSMPLGSRFEYGGVEGMARKMYGVLVRLIKEAEAGRGRPILPLILLTITVSNFSAGHERTLGDITKFFLKAPVQSRQAQRPLVADQGQDQYKELSVVRGPERSPTSSAVKAECQTVKQPETKEMSTKRRFFQPREVEKDHLVVDSDPPSETTGRSSPSECQSQTTTAIILCDQCPSPGQHIPVEEWEQHADFHFALRLLEDDRKQQQTERQQQAGAINGSRTQGINAGSKRSSSSNSGASSIRGTRKKAATVSKVSSSASTSSNVTSTVPLSKYFRPSAN
ncbi:DNA-directed DNA polymerase eta rad30 [Modicella reniformis]|uniref:DNA polymerase eta n=1 Tax=Modicella reniformis TaxID=1440133 RepID=A0A9P6IMZ2_9FUNG|nr:DNA-directed DNA polymerase eta rad30 [Modicella reniformis]